MMYFYFILVLSCIHSMTHTYRGNTVDKTMPCNGKPKNHATAYAEKRNCSSIFHKRMPLENTGQLNTENDDIMMTDDTHVHHGDFRIFLLLLRFGKSKSIKLASSCSWLSLCCGRADTVPLHACLSCGKVIARCWCGV